MLYEQVTPARGREYSELAPDRVQHAHMIVDEMLADVRFRFAAVIGRARIELPPPRPCPSNVANACSVAGSTGVALTLARTLAFVRTRVPHDRFVAVRARWRQVVSAA
jgi:hypothetical protein